MSINKIITANDSALYDVLKSAKVIAVVGHSDDPSRTSYRIAQYLRTVGYKVYAVNPTVESIDGEKSYASVSDIPEHVDLVNVFRRSSFLPDAFEDAIRAGADTVWAQLGLAHDGAAEKAAEAGLNVVMDRCIKIEHMRLRVGLHS
jgi:uncharacterized protein